MATTQQPQCDRCKHLSDELWAMKCTAFPKGIPEDIIANEFIHTKIHPKQKNDVLFVPNNEPISTLTDTELRYILETVSEKEMPDEGTMMIKVGAELHPTEFRTGKDKKGVYIKIRQNLFKGWMTAYKDDSLYAGSIRALIEQGLMKKPDIPRDAETILTLTGKRFNEQVTGKQVKYQDREMRIVKVANSKHGVYIELEDDQGTVTVHQKYLPEEFHQLLKQME